MTIGWDLVEVFIKFLTCGQCKGPAQKILMRLILLVCLGLDLALIIWDAANSTQSEKGAHICYTLLGIRLLHLSILAIIFQCPCACCPPAKGVLHFSIVIIALHVVCIVLVGIILEVRWGWEPSKEWKGKISCEAVSVLLSIFAVISLRALGTDMERNPHRYEESD